jgi:choline kinase
MKVLILAAGRGSRMEHLTNEKPKCLTVFRHQPLIERTLNLLQRHVPLTNICVITGYRAEALAYLPVTKIHNQDWDKTNIIGSLLVARNSLRKEDCLVIYSDIFFEDSAITSMLEVKGSAVLSVLNWLTVWNSRFINPLEDLETFKFDPDTFLLKEIGKRATSLEDIEGQFAGIFKITPQTWSKIEEFPEELKSLDTTSMLQLCISRSLAFKVVPYHDSWAELDNIHDIEAQE